MSQHTNALFAELLNLLPAGTVMPVAKTELSPMATTEVTQGPQVPHVPQVQATIAMATSISWPGQAAMPVASSTQAISQPVVPATSANVGTTATVASTQVNTASVGMSTAPTAAVSASQVVTLTLALDTN